MFHGTAPFKGIRMETILNQITANTIAFKRSLNPVIKDLICKLLKFYPNDRPSIEDIFNHPLIEELDQKYGSSRKTIDKLELYRLKRRVPTSTQNLYQNPLRAKLHPKTYALNTQPDQ